MSDISLEKLDWEKVEKFKKSYKETRDFSYIELNDTKKDTISLEGKGFSKEKNQEKIRQLFIERLLKICTDSLAVLIAEGYDECLNYKNPIERVLFNKLYYLDLKDKNKRAFAAYEAIDHSDKCADLINDNNSLAACISYAVAHDNWEYIIKSDAAKNSKRGAESTLGRKKARESKKDSLADRDFMIRREAEQIRANHPNYADNNSWVATEQIRINNNDGIKLPSKRQLLRIYNK